MAKLTEKQQRFADEYIRTGDVMRSYMNAYQNVTKENSANAGGSRLLRNVNVRSYIDKRLEELKSKAIADQEEVLSYLTSIMRGEHKEQVLKGIGMGEQMIANMDVPANQRIKAAELLGKRYGIWTEKHEVKDVTPRFVEDVPDDDD